MYVFDQPWSFDGWGPNFAYCNGYSCHGVELPLTFGTGALLAHSAPSQRGWHSAH